MTVRPCAFDEQLIFVAATRNLTACPQCAPVNDLSRAAVTTTHPSTLIASVGGEMEHD